MNPASWMERTLPLCAYPRVARCKGAGSTDDAADFECVAPGRQVPVTAENSVGVGDHCDDRRISEDQPQSADRGFPLCRFEIACPVIPKELESGD